MVDNNSVDSGTNHYFFIKIENDDYYARANNDAEKNDSILSS